MDVKMVCSLCGGTASTMLVREKKIVCFDCVAKKYPAHLVKLIYYLTAKKHVGEDDGSGTKKLSCSYKLHAGSPTIELVATTPFQN